MKRNVRYFIVIMLIAFLAMSVLVSCDSAVQAEEETPSYTRYYATRGGRLNENEWFLLAKSSWIFHDGSNGTYTVNQEILTFFEGENTWATGVQIDDKLALTKEGETILFYKQGTKMPLETTPLSILTVYNEAVDLGFTGTLEELIEAFRGESGLSAYEVAVQNGYDGTEATWIASLAGSNGLTPTIGENGNWFVGETDTGVSASGAVNAIEKIEKTATEENVDTYTIYTTDGNTYDFTVTNGLDGTAAEKGAGIDKIEKTKTENNVDTYTMYYSDGKTYTYTVTNGQDGKDGQDGQNGKDGKDFDIVSMYDEAVEQGYQGSYLDFVKDCLNVNTDSYTDVSASCFSVVSVLCVYQYSYFGMVMKGTSSGSGIFYSVDKETGDAYIVTNYHVAFASQRVEVSGNTVTSAPGIADDIYVYLFGSEVIGNEYYTNVDYPGMYIEAEYIGGSMNYDIALLKITGSDRIKNSQAKPAIFSDSNKISIGQTAWAAGNSGGDGISLTKGVINVTSESLTLTGADDKTSISLRVIRYDTAVNPGNSGGALLNSKGEVIGVVNAKMVDSSYDNVAYAIPSNVAINIVENILYYYEKAGNVGPVQVKKLLFGISYTSSESYAYLDEDTGEITLTDNLRVASVNDDSLVYGQVETGDIITQVSVDRGGEVAEYVLTRAYILADLTATLRAGDIVTLTLVRGTETKTAVVTVTENNLIVAE